MAVIDHVPAPLKKTFTRARRFVRLPSGTYMSQRKKPLYKGVCLLEGGQGKNINGNMFALAREIAHNPEFSSLQGMFVVTENTLEQAQERLREYGIDMPVVDRASKDYQRYLARCEFLFTDNSFPPYFDKRPDQVYVNTWHGTPLKQLGRSNIGNSLRSLANVQKNMLAADYLLFPNELAKSCFFDDYMIGKVFSGKYFYADYPRNDSLVSDSIRRRVRDEQDLHGKNVIAYMPTWRGKARFADVEGQAKRTKEILDELDSRLPSGSVFYVNLHFLLGEVIDYSGWQNIRPFPSCYETYDFLAACDVLVTDYSSVMFDFAVTRRKIVLYPYDLDEYLKDVGTYVPYETLPFPMASSTAHLAELVSSGSSEPYDEFYDTYCPYHDGRAAQGLLRHVCLGVESLDERGNPQAGPVSLAYVRNFNSQLVRATVKAEIERDWPENGMLAFMGRYGKRNLNFLKELPEDVDYLAITASKNLTRLQKLGTAVSRRSSALSHLITPAMAPALAHDLERLLSGLRVESVVSYAPTDDYFQKLLGTLDCKKTAILRESTLLASRKEKTLSVLEEGSFDLVEGDELPLSAFTEENLAAYYNRSASCRLMTRHHVKRDDGVAMRGLALVRLPRHLDPSEVSFVLPDGRQIGTLSTLRSSGTTYVARYELRYDAAEANLLGITNQVYMYHMDQDGRGLRVRVRYNRADRKHSTGRHGEFCIDEENETTLYFRQGAKNFLVLTSRKTNPMDYRANRVRLEAAYLLSRLPLGHGAIVLYEKMSSRYEESASVVYERLIDMGYTNVHFILDRAALDKLDVDPKYRRNIVVKDTFRHYYLFFTARSFIGTETMPHSIELRSDNRRIRARLKDPTVNYVFLQHGVMYMVSLDSKSRTFFRPRKTTTGLFRVVTSSWLEKRHFAERGHYPTEALYVCGLPKFDRNQWRPGADKILVMLTWRPWEENAARLDFENTGYYRLMEEIVRSIPDDLKNRVVLVTHPLFQQFIGNREFPLRRYLDSETSYDELLRDAKVLITDYSSIAYDAFYRGANVVFYWKDKDECMEAYGENTELMINEDNIFGDICHDPARLAESVRRGCDNGQDPEHLRRYGEIVEFHDGRNTERLIGMLQEDGII